MSSEEPLPDFFDEEQAREIVIDYVQTHPGCSKEEILMKQNKIGKKNYIDGIQNIKRTISKKTCNVIKITYMMTIILTHTINNTINHLLMK
jgi:hypothetical protein